MTSTDLHHIEARHDEIDQRLRDWARYVMVRPPRWVCQPMFRSYRPPRQYSYETADIPVPINAIEAMEIEKAVYFLPDQHRDAVRWFYVRTWMHPGVMQRRLGVTQDGLCKVLCDSREMLKNRLKTKLVESVDRRRAVC